MAATPSYDEYEQIKEDALRRRLWANSGVEARFVDKKQGDLQQHVGWHTNFLKAAAAALDRRGLVFLLSEKRGTGKTQCAVQLIRLACDSLQSAHYTRRRSIGMAIRGTYRNDSTEAEVNVISRLCSYDLLVIDECQESPDTEFEQKALTHLVDLRYAGSKPTIMIANCSARNLKGLVGPSIYDRAFEGGGILLFEFDSFRRTNGHSSDQHEGGP